MVAFTYYLHLQPLNCIYQYYTSQPHKHQPRTHQQPANTTSYGFHKFINYNNFTNKKNFHLSSESPAPRPPTMAATKPSVKEAQQLASTDPRKAEAIYKEIISKPPSVTSDAAVKEYESALISLGELYRDEK